MGSTLQLNKPNEKIIMTTAFKDLGITADIKTLVGDKIKIERILNREVIVDAFRIVDSKYEGKRLDMQLDLDGEKRVTWTGSNILQDMILKVPEGKFPFKTTIVKTNDHYEFT